MLTKNRLTTVSILFVFLKMHIHLKIKLNTRKTNEVNKFRETTNNNKIKMLKLKSFYVFKLIKKIFKYSKKKITTLKTANNLVNELLSKSNSVNQEKNSNAGNASKI